MGTRTLTRCAACDRHVYLADTACPFCGDASPRAPQTPRVGSSLSRAASHAARVALIAGAVACAKSNEPDSGAPGATAMESGVDASGNDASQASPDASFPATDAAIADAQPPPADAGKQDGSPAFDGAVAPADAAPADAAQADAAVASDAGDEWEEDATYVPIYGGVFPDPRKRAVV